MVATPSFYPGEGAPCFAIFIANDWSKPVKVTVDRGGTPYDPATFGRIATAGSPESAWPTIPATGVPSGEVAVLFMSSDPSAIVQCPVPDAIASSTAIKGTGTGKAWHVSTDVPVSGYDILPYGGASSYLPSAELVLPTTAWGTNYFGIVPLRGNASASEGLQWGQIVGTADGTTVQVAPNVDLPSGTGVAAAPKGATTSYTLNAGDVVQWQDSTEMSGTVISSDKPIGFTGGLGYDCYTSATSTGGGCDSAHQQIPPLSAFGSLYVAPPFATRRADMNPESIPYRVLAAVDGTTLTYDPPIAGAPTTLAAGAVGGFESTTAFVVKSQDNSHPFYVGQIMPGCHVTSGSRNGSCLGDEEYVNILPPAQFLTKYVFFTDSTYNTTNLVFTRVKTPEGFQDVKLDCAGTLASWKPVDAADTYEVTNVDIQRASVPNGACKNGPQVASSAGPFGLMVWGEDEAASYAYPAGGNVAPINAVVVPPTPR